MKSIILLFGISLFVIIGVFTTVYGLMFIHVIK